MNGSVEAIQKLQRLLAQIPEGGLDLNRLQEAIYQARYTGPYTVHNRNGIPHQIDLGSPIRLSIVQGERPQGDLTRVGKVIDPT